MKIDRGALVFCLSFVASLEGGLAACNSGGSDKVSDAGDASGDVSADAVSSADSSTEAVATAQDAGTSIDAPTATGDDSGGVPACGDWYPELSVPELKSLVNAVAACVVAVSCDPYYVDKVTASDCVSLYGAMAEVCSVSPDKGAGISYGVPDGGEGCAGYEQEGGIIASCVLPPSTMTACSQPGTSTCTSSNVLDRCTSSGTLLAYDCTTASLVCSTNDAGISGCVSPGCTAHEVSTCQEHCDGTWASLCIGGAPYTVDCKAYGFTSCADQKTDSKAVGAYCL